MSERTELEHISYEVDMLRYCFQRLKSCENTTPETNAFLESFLVHTRNLIYFLEGPWKYDDIRCADFCGSDNKPITKVPVGLNADLKNKIHKHCLHLTKTRLNEKVFWPVEKIARAINQSAGQFFDKVSTRS